MKYDELFEIVGAAPVFDSSLLATGDVDVTDVASQLARCSEAPGSSVGGRCAGADIEPRG